VQFTPHYLVWVCPDSYHKSEECQSQCIRQGRYCTPDPDGDLAKGYSGADIVQVRTTLIFSEQVSFESPSTVLAYSLHARPRWRPRQGLLRRRHRSGAGCICASGYSIRVSLHSRMSPEHAPDPNGDLAKDTSGAGIDAGQRFPSSCARSPLRACCALLLLVNTLWHHHLKILASAPAGEPAAAVRVPTGQ